MRNKWPREVSCQHCSKIRLIYKPTGCVNNFCNAQCQQDFYYKTKAVPAIESGERSPQLYNTSVRRYLTERDGYSCSECGIREWRGRPLSLDIDHVDGNNKNHKASNLRFLCPNCHRQTDTWGNKTRVAPDGKAPA